MKMALFELKSFPQTKFSLMVTIAVVFPTETLLVSTKLVQFHTQSRADKQKSDFGQQKTNKQNFIHWLIQEVAQM